MNKHFTLRDMGLGRKPDPRPIKPVAPAARSKSNLSTADVAHITRLIGAMFNIEESAVALRHCPAFGSQIQLELNAIIKGARELNQRFLSEFSEADGKLVDTLNQAGALFNRASFLFMSVPPDIAERAANAAAQVVEDWRTSTER